MSEPLPFAERVDRKSAALEAAASLLTSAHTWALLLLVLGASGLFFGIELVAGLGWALIAASTLSLVVAVLIFVGIARSGPIEK